MPLATPLLLGRGPTHVPMRGVRGKRSINSHTSDTAINQADSQMQNYWYNRISLRTYILISAAILRKRRATDKTE